MNAERSGLPGSVRAGHWRRLGHVNGPAVLWVFALFVPIRWSQDKQGAPLSRQSGRTHWKNLATSARCCTAAAARVCMLGSWMRLLVGSAANCRSRGDPLQSFLPTSAASISCCPAVVPGFHVLAPGPSHHRITARGSPTDLCRRPGVTQSQCLSLRASAYCSLVGGSGQSEG